MLLTCFNRIYSVEDMDSEDNKAIFIENLHASHNKQSQVYRYTGC